MMDRELKFPKAVLFVLQQLHTYGKDAYFVGGCVRDMLLGRPVYDYDICTDALPGEVQSIFLKTVDTGIKNGTVTVIHDKIHVEVTTYRIDGGYLDARHPQQVTFTDDLYEDLKRRDFTVNAMCYHPTQGLIDRVNGMDDLDRKILRAIGDPDERFYEDALRMIRAVRFSAALGFTIEEETKRAIVRHARRIEKVSRERVQVEWNRILLCDTPAGIWQLSELGLLSYISPALAHVLPEHKRPDGVFVLPQDLPLRLGAIFVPLSAGEIQSALTGLRYSNLLIKEALAFAALLQDPPAAEKYAVKCALHQYGFALFQKILVGYEFILEQDTALYRHILDEIQTGGECYKLRDLKIGGEDLKQLGFCGPAIGKMLLLLLDDVMQNPQNNNREKLLETAKKVL